MKYFIALPAEENPENEIVMVNICANDVHEADLFYRQWLKKHGHDDRAAVLYQEMPHRLGVITFNKCRITRSRFDADGNIIFDERLDDCTHPCSTT